MKTWDYRVIRHNAEDGDAGTDYLAVHIVYYEHDAPVMVSRKPAMPDKYTLAELRQEFEALLKAFDEPILDFDSFGHTTDYDEQRTYEHHND
jgi:hypothetical protein